MADETPARAPAAEGDGSCTWPSRGRGRRIRRRWIVAGTALLVAGVGTWQGLAAKGTSSHVLTGQTGRPAPGFDLPVPTDPTVHLSLAHFRGKDVVVNFWASWCVPCRTEMPLLESAFRELKGKIDFLGIATNDSPNAARAFLAQVGVTYPAVSDQNAGVATTYGVYGLPTTVFVSPSGTVLGRHVGQLHEATLRAALKEAFGVSM